MREAGTTFDGELATDEDTTIEDRVNGGFEDTVDGGLRSMLDCESLLVS